MTPTFYITIATYNRLEYTKQSIQSLYDTNDENLFELCIIDDNSNDNTPEYLKELVKIKSNISCYLLHERCGVARAHNFGLQFRKSEQYWVKMDNDCVHKTNNWLLKELKLFQENSHVGIIGINWHHMTEYQKDALLPFQGGDHILGFCKTTRPEVIDKLGFYNDETTYGWDDILYTRKAHQIGYRVGYYACEEVNPDDYIESQHIQNTGVNEQEYIDWKHEQATEKTPYYLQEYNNIISNKDCSVKTTIMQNFTNYTKL